MTQTTLIHATRPLLDEKAAWLTILADERRSSPHTIEAYERDLRQFLVFLTDYHARPAQLADLAENGPTAEELAKAKAYVKGAYAIRNLDSSAAIASTLLDIQLDDLGIDYIDKRQDLIDAVTLDDVKAQAEALLSAPPTIITVGPAGA